MKKITLLATLVATVVGMTGLSGAFAQTGGEIIWSVDLTQTARTSAPRVAPSGDIYIHSDDLYAISSTGQIKWRKNSSDPKAVDVGPDGTVYSGSGGTIFAYTPAGQLLWSFTEPPGGQGLMAGPTVGADSNIYAVTDSGGLGAFSLTPGGQLIWNQPGYVNFQGTGLAPVPLTPTRLYFAEDIVPGCNGFAEGLNALDLDGNLLWCHSFGDVSLAIASPNGDALVHDAALLYDYNPDGSLDWAFDFGFPSGTLIGPSAAPDGTIYIFHSNFNLWSLTAAGQKRWEKDGVAGDNFPVAPTVSPDGSVIVFGTFFSFGVNGKLVAVKAADGSVLWTLTITGPSAGVAGPVSFSNDGETIYAPIHEISGINKLLAVSVRGNSGGGIPCGDLVSFQARCKSGGGGQKLQAKLTLTNTSHSGEQVTITVDGNPTPVTINGNKAQLSINNPAPGEHTLELTDPAGCFPPMMPSCN